MNTSKREQGPNLVRPDYYTLLWFENALLTGAVLQDDYTAWFDLAAGIEGSNLADENRDDATREQLVEFLREYYLTTENAILYYAAIETNEPELATGLYPEFLDRGYVFIPIQEKHQITIEEIRKKAHEQYKHWTEGTDA